MKKILIIFLAFFLISCFGKTTSNTNTSLPSTEFSGSGFSMQIPNNWNYNGTTDNLNAGRGTIILGAVSPDKKYNFANNIVIIEDDLNAVGSSRQYSEQNNIQTQKKYFEYKFLESGVIIFEDSDETKYYTFEAKYNNHTQKLKFIQAAKMCGTKAYLMHASMSLDSKSSDFVELFRTFKCK